MPEQSKIKKVDISFTNWMLGGSLISVRDGDQGRHRASSRKVAVLEVTDGKPPKIATAEKKSEDEVITKNLSGDGKKDKTKAKEGDQKGGNKDAIKKGGAIKQGGGDAKKCCKDCGQASDDDAVDKTGDGKPEKTKKDDFKPFGSIYDVDAGTELFTDAEDAKINDMKANNKSWKEIATAVGASKEEVMFRFQELVANDKDKIEDDAKKYGGGKGVTADDIGLDFENLFLDDNWGVSPQPAGGAEEGNMSSPAGRDNGKSNKSGTSQKAYGDELVSGRSFGSGLDDGDGAPVGRSGNGCGYPELNPDVHWSEADCDLLMFLESRYVDEKWLQMQAGFFNWTGRMVAAEIIKAKFEKDGLA